ncbi:MAG: potassium transporter TrkG [Thermodesulfobacteriota bacterium]
MRARAIARVVGVLTAFTGLAMLLPLVVSLLHSENRSAKALLLSCGITMGAGGGMYLSSGRERYILSHREGMAVVALGWALAGLFGGLPFYIGEVFPSFTDAAFESISGFTTTGSSVLTDIESVDRGMLLWRSFIQWLGGMGIIVLSLAVLPFLGVGGMQLYKAEVPSPVPDKLTPRIRETAALLWKVYILFTALQVLLLSAGGMDLFESVCHSFTTMPTGGFSTRNASVGEFESAYFEWVIVAFMALAGVNFTLHYRALTGNPRSFTKDPECRVYLALLAGLTLLVALDTHGPVYQSFGKALRYAAFQVTSILTTTGYATADYEKWPAFSQLILMLCMFVGASAGSTGGAMKVLRVVLVAKYCYRELFRLIHPRVVMPVKLGKKAVPEEVLHGVMGFFALYMGVFAVSGVILCLMGVDLVTSLAAVAATMGNIGPGIGDVGPMENFAHIPAAGKWLLMWCMLLGRLEIYTIIILLVPEFWRK